ncbi:MAG: flagellar filament capping protein FliD [Pseudomonadales bacterium]|nr:flagellar filament capping protein FliD [Pseudomonadales bacterium]
MAETTTTPAAGTSGTALVQAMQMGSGVDIQALATALAQAETQPKIDSYTSKKEASTVSVSGYGQLKGSISLVKLAFDNLKDVSDITNKAVTNSKPATLTASVSSGTDLQTASYDIVVDQLAQGTITASNGFTSKTQVLNSASAFSIDFTIGTTSPTVSSVSVTTDTPAGIVSAVNAADIGITARLVNRSATGNDWVVLFEGTTGIENAFTATSTPDIGLGEANNRLQTAQNSSITVNGLDSIERASNKLTDVIPGLELNVTAVDSNPVRLSIAEDTSVLRTAIDDLVATYNAFRQTATELTNKNAETGEAGALAKDKTFVSMLQNQIKGLLDLESSTASGGISTLRDLGLSVQLSGDLTLDEDTFASVISSNLSDVVTMLTANTDNQSDFDGGSKGLALDSSLVLKGMLDTSGPISSRQATAESRVEDYEAQLADLEKRLAATQQRYIEQFAAMESLVQRSKSTGDYLKGQFTAMENMYKS